MTELEYLTRKRNLHPSDYFCEIAHECKYGSCAGKLCEDCEFNGNVHLCLEVMLAEHKEKIKLKRWERDLIANSIEESGIGIHRFRGCFELYGMKEKGYFTGVNDVDMELKDILANCEVEER